MDQINTTEAIYSRLYIQQHTGGFTENNIGPRTF